MLVVALVMLVILALAALVVTYVAYPHRGEDVPAAPWLGDAMARAVDAAPTLTPEEAQDGHDDRSDEHHGSDWDVRRLV